MSKSRSESKTPPVVVQPQDEDDKPEDFDATASVDSASTKQDPSPTSKHGSSESNTPAPTSAPSKPRPAGPQLIGDLPRAETEALATFVQMPANHYQYGTLGRSREALESMTCDCQFEPGVDGPEVACGHDSDCINRLTQVECLAEDCRCRNYCQNQRFQRREYANIEIVQTEKKGFGLRAGADLPKDTFIYEYVGDVVSHPSFMKRMREYAEEGIRHFYFMMLQKDEYIDATKRGGIGRFANHSCNPNCYVAKWTIGNHVRMGIFASRLVRMNEELTFNYNVDRYGHDAQPCYCGEAKCVGFIGGKTQTDIAGMDDLYLDALGITDEVDRLGLKGSKKKKSKKLDEDYMPELKPLLEKDTPKVVQAIRQTQSKKVLFKLLTRIRITEDQAALRQIMRLRGFSLMTNILEDHAKDIDIVVAALQCMGNWPLIQRNKVDDSKIRVPVQACAHSDHDTMKELAQKLLDHWDTLEYAYRIPKRMKANGEEEPTLPTSIIIDAHELDARPLKKTRLVEFDDPLPERRLVSKGFTSSVVVQERIAAPQAAQRIKSSSQTRKEILAVIAAANAAAAAAEAAKPPPPPPEVPKKPKARKKHQTPEEREANKEKRLLKLVGGVVVKCMSKYAKQLDHEQFKKHAKELTHVIAEKEKKSTSYKEGKLDALSDEKAAKIKKFSKEYIAKVLRKLEKSKRKPSSSHSHSHAGGSATAPDSPEHDHEDVMTVEQAMDFGADDSGSEDGGGEDMDMDNAEPAPNGPANDGQHSNSSEDMQPSPMEGVADRPPDSVTVTPVTPPVDSGVVTTDPRLRVDPSWGCPDASTTSAGGGWAVSGW
ncbi:hypothetical protein BJ138DRAFT_522413 [Hygrophoropsis aurantiaca]|uniref:Uncharacterized protein n=1 Tax=Hygrophoropsis aurantiaca TaxID=72124 RepID=A0ACB8A1C6_9AGAM|nr:hypothetical protein BJ138DRAFT_522413 [Hygrophoropsis aurantiaca]